jgi:hypothetical protein
MSKSAMLAAAAALAILSNSGPVAAKPVHKPFTMLWNQNSNFGSGVNSQNYESSMEAYDDAGADDFVIPTGQTWLISEVDVTGSYTDGSGPASSEAVAFYRTKKGKPYRIYRGPYTVDCTDMSGSFQCILPTRGRHGKPLVKLAAGTYWVSIVANCDSQTCGQWNWTENTTVHGYEAMWTNYGGGQGRGCSGFEPLDFCFGGSPADLAFDILGELD